MVQLQFPGEPLAALQEQSASRGSTVTLAWRSVRHGVLGEVPAAASLPEGLR